MVCCIWQWCDEADKRCYCCTGLAGVEPHDQQWLGSDHQLPESPEVSKEWCQHKGRFDLGGGQMG